MGRFFPQIRLTPRQWTSLVLGLVACAGLVLLYRNIDVDAWHARAARLNAWAVFALITALPLLGFPVSVLHVVAGVRFGAGLGFVLVSLSILLQLLASYALVHMRHDLFARRFADVQRKIPPGAHGPVALFTMLLPGVPYFAKNYVLPLIGLPLRTYLLWCFPLHSARSTVAIFFGHQSDRLTPLNIAGFALYGVALMLTCAWAFRRLREQLPNRPPAANDPKPAA